MASPIKLTAKEVAELEDLFKGAVYKGQDVIEGVKRLITVEIEGMAFTLPPGVLERLHNRPDFDKTPVEEVIKGKLQQAIWQFCGSN